MNSILLFVCIAVLAAAVVLLTLTLVTHSRIKRIVRESKDFADGDYNDPITVKAHGSLGFLTDVMNFMAGELNSLEDNQRKFVSNISHDFRSPLTSIKGYASAMADGTIPPEMQEKYLHVIISEAERLEALTDRILELNKYSDRGGYLDFSTFDLNENIRRAVLTFEGRTGEKNLSIRLNLTDQPLMVRADSGRIDQILHNLIDNAVKFSPDNATVDIGTSVNNGKAFTSIKDYGIGISRENQSRIWERFYKTDPSRGKDKTGTGLGLAIVKEIISSHHENINVISTEGAGTEFIFSLSLAKTE